MGIIKDQIFFVKGKYHHIAPDLIRLINDILERSYFPIAMRKVISDNWQKLKVVITALKSTSLSKSDYLEYLRRVNLGIYAMIILINDFGLSFETEQIVSYDSITTKSGLIVPSRKTALPLKLPSENTLILEDIYKEAHANLTK